MVQAYPVARGVTDKHVLSVCLYVCCACPHTAQGIILSIYFEVLDLLRRYAVDLRTMSYVPNHNQRLRTAAKEPSTVQPPINAPLIPIITRQGRTAWPAAWPTLKPSGAVPWAPPTGSTWSPGWRTAPRACSSPPAAAARCSTIPRCARWPAWKCCRHTCLAHIQAHQPSLGVIAGAPVGPPGNASNEWDLSHIQAHQRSVASLGAPVGPPGNASNKWGVTHIQARQPRFFSSRTTTPTHRPPARPRPWINSTSKSFMYCTSYSSK